MIDTSKTPTSYDVANKARLLYRLATAAAEKAAGCTYDTPRETIDEFAEFLEMLKESAFEVYALADVAAENSAFSDFFGKAVQ